MRGVEKWSYFVMIMTSMTQLKCEQSLVQKSAETFQHDLNLQCTRSCTAKELEITRNRGRLSFCREQLRHANAATATALERLETREPWDMVDILHHSYISKWQRCVNSEFGDSQLYPSIIVITLFIPSTGAFLAWVASTTKHQWQDRSIRPSLSWWHPPADATWDAPKINRPKSGFVLRSESPSKPPQTSKSQVQNGPELAELVETKHNFLWNISESRFDLLNSLS